jgi:hypothetical protein
MWFKLGGDARLHRCATEGCGAQPIWRLEVDGTGSNYCSGCKEHIDRGRTAALEVHDWFIFERKGWECCRNCGIIRRLDGKNSPCKGAVKVGLR